jgi:hypothetical protein
LERHFQKLEHQLNLCLISLSLVNNVENYLAKRIRNTLMQVARLLRHSFSEDAEHFGQIRDQCLFEYFSRHAKYLQVFFLLLGLHVVVEFTQQGKKEQHMLVICDLHSHELADFFLCDRNRMRC